MQIESVAAAFATYRAAVLPTDAPDVQVVECRRAFTAGVYFLLMGALHALGDDSTPEDDAVAQLEALKAECEAFAVTPAPPSADETAPVPPDVFAELERLAAMRRAAAASGILLTGPDRPAYGVPPADIHHEAPAPLVREMRPQLERLGHRIGDDLPDGWGFALFLFELGEHGHTFYIANCDRADVLLALREFLRRQVS